MDDQALVINESLSIPTSELTYRAVRSGGPGGQHVNTSATRVELSWNVRESPSLDDAQRDRLHAKLGKRVDGRGVLRLVESGSRSQHRNRETVTARFVRLLAKALVVPKKRRPTRPPKSASEKRLKEKKRRSEVKQKRGPVGGEE